MHAVATQTGISTNHPLYVEAKGLETQFNRFLEEQRNCEASSDNASHHGQRQLDDVSTISFPNIPNLANKSLPNVADTDIGADFMRTGNEHLTNNQLDNAKEYWGCALEFFENVPEGMAKVGNCCHHIGSVLVKHHQPEETWTYFQKARNVCNDMVRTADNKNDPLMLASCYQSMGKIRIGQEKLLEASELFEKAKNILKYLDPDSLDVARSYDLLGDALLLQEHRLAEAHEHFEKAHQICQRVAAAPSVILERIRLHVATTRSQQKDYHGAVVMAQDACVVFFCSLDQDAS